jgi:hypothetical protein
MEYFTEQLAKYSDLKNENHILRKLESDGTYRPAVSSSSESLIKKVRKLIFDNKDALNQQPIQYLKSIWKQLSVNTAYEATSYATEYGVNRKLEIEPISIYQLTESLHILTKNLGKGNYNDGILLVVMCKTSTEIDEAKKIAAMVVSEPQYSQILLAIPKEPIKITDLLMEHQALHYLQKHEANLYNSGGELHNSKICLTDFLTFKDSGD